MMGMILELIGGRRTLYIMAVGFVLGLLVGWFVLGWGIAPVAWKDAAPVDLHPDYQKIFVSAVADSYSIRGNAELAKAVLSERWDKAALERVVSQLKAEAADEAQVQRLDALAQVLGISAVPIAGATPIPGTPSTGQTSLVSRLLPLCGVFLLVVAVVALAGLLMRSVSGRRVPTEAGVGLAGRMQEAISPEVAEVMPSGALLGHFITSYALGNDHYDDSFSIETGSGEFLGECGMGIGETIGVGSPDKVTAFELWLFDKNAIRTETKVVMSAHAFNDESLRSRLATRGDPVLAEPGKVIPLETASLQVTARITEMAYSAAAAPPQSYFDRISVELAVSFKEGGEMGDL